METLTTVRSATRINTNSAAHKGSHMGSSMKESPNGGYRASESYASPATRMQQKVRKSFDSTESAGPGQNSNKRQRQSLDSVSAATKTIVASQDTLGSSRLEKTSMKRKSRVTFSPEIVSRTQQEHSDSSQSPNSFGNVSPIVMSDSPVSARSASQSGGKGELSDVDQTADSTSPEVFGDVPNPNLGQRSSRDDFSRCPS
jgi:hypothetical protein